MIRNYFFVASFMMLALPILAQSNFQPGYFINAKGDTISGLINLKEWHRNPTSINFKSDEGQASDIDLLKEEVKYFEIKGLEAYEKFKVSISLDATAFPHLPVGVDTSRTTGEVFLRVLHKGKNVNLYSYTDNVKTRFYLKDKAEETPRELVYKFYYKDSDQKETHTSKVYQNQLKYFAGKHQALTPGLTNKIESAFYDKDDLVKVVKAINGNEKAEKSASEDKQVSVTEFYIGIGVNKSTITNTGKNIFNVDHIEQTTNRVFYKKETKTSSILPFLSLGMNFYPFPKVKRLAIRTDLSLINFHTKMDRTVEQYGYTLRNTYEFTSIIPSLSPQVIYNLYNKENFKIYLGAGFNCSANIALKDSYKTYSERPDSTETTGLLEDPYNYRKMWVNITGRAGLQIAKRFDLSYMIYSPLTFLESKEFFVLNSMSVQLNYLLGKK